MRSQKARLRSRTVVDQGEALTVVLHSIGQGKQGKKIATCPQDDDDNDIRNDGNLVILDGLWHTVVSGEMLVEVILIMKGMGVRGSGAGYCSQTWAGAILQMLVTPVLVECFMLIMTLLYHWLIFLLFFWFIISHIGEGVVGV